MGTRNLIRQGTYFRFRQGLTLIWAAGGIYDFRNFEQA